MGGDRGHLSQGVEVGQRRDIGGGTHLKDIVGIIEIDLHQGDMIGNMDDIIERMNIIIEIKHIKNKNTLLLKLKVKDNSNIDNSIKILRNKMMNQ